MTPAKGIGSVDSLDNAGKTDPRPSKYPKQLPLSKNEGYIYGCHVLYGGIAFGTPKQGSRKVNKEGIPEVCQFFTIREALGEAEEQITIGRLPEVQNCEPKLFTLHGAPSV